MTRGQDATFDSQSQSPLPIRFHKRGTREAEEPVIEDAIKKMSGDIEKNSISSAPHGASPVRQPETIHPFVTPLRKSAKPSTSPPTANLSTKDVKAWWLELEDQVWNIQARLAREKANKWSNESRPAPTDAIITDNALKLLIASKAFAADKQIFRRFAFLNHMNILLYERELLAIEESYHCDLRSILGPDETDKLRKLLAGYSRFPFLLFEM